VFFLDEKTYVHIGERLHKWDLKLTKGKVISTKLRYLWINVIGGTGEWGDDYLSEYSLAFYLKV
jgi:hypothetical protein